MKIRLTIDGRLYKFDSADDVPEEYRERVKYYVYRDDLRIRSKRASTTYRISPECFVHIKGTEPKKEDRQKDYHL